MSIGPVVTRGYAIGSIALVVLRGYTAGAVTNPPTITSVSPATGTVLGGTTVTIIGTNLTGATSVTFGGIPARDFQVLNSRTITATTPADVAGLVDVDVTTASGSGIGSQLYTYARGGGLRQHGKRSFTDDPRIKIIGDDGKLVPAAAAIAKADRPALQKSPPGINREAEEIEELMAFAMEYFD